MMDSQTYKVRYSTAKHFGAISDFYSSDMRRTSSVFLRSDAVLKEQAELGRFITVWNQQECLVAASSLYVLADGKEIDCVIHDRGHVERGRVVELGSVLRVGKDPSDPQIDKGFWRFILFGLPMIAALKFDLPIDIMMCGVNNTPSGDRTKRYIRGEYEGSPLKYKESTPAKEFLEAIGVVTDDQVMADSKFFRAYAPDVISVARTLRQIARNGHIKDMRPPHSIGYDRNMKVQVDLSELGIEALLQSISDNQVYLNRASRTLSWGEAGRELRNRVVPSNGNSPLSDPGTPMVALGRHDGSFLNAAITG